jgi:hypothetical protein
MKCPQCNARVPAKSLWTIHGLSSVTCPHCHASLCPNPMGTLVLFGISFGMGLLVVAALRREGANLLMSLGAFFVVVAAVYAVMGPMILSLRAKDNGSGRLNERVL